MYTLIFMSSRGDSIRQRAIGKGHILFFLIAIPVLFLTGIGGLGYGIFQKQQKVAAEKDRQTSIEKSEELLRAKLKIESEFNAVDEEMQAIRQMTKQIQQTLGILGQGGGSKITSAPGETEGQMIDEQEDRPTIPDPAINSHEHEEPLTPKALKQEVQSLYEYISTHKKRLDRYPLILPVKLQQANGEKYTFWYSSGFGRRIHPFTKRYEFHQGLDIKTHSGVPVIAAADGTVAQIGKSGYLGNTIEIIHDASEYKTLYAHLKNYAEGLEVNQEVVRGQIIGYVGNTGRSTGTHLHYGIYDMGKEEWVNPIMFIFDQEPTFSP